MEFVARDLKAMCRFEEGQKPIQVDAKQLKNLYICTYNWSKEGSTNACLQHAEISNMCG